MCSLMQSDLRSRSAAASQIGDLAASAGEETIMALRIMVR